MLGKSLPGKQTNTEIYTDRPAMTCPVCGKPTARRSHRRHYFEFLRTRWTGKVPFRCVTCQRRMWLLIDPRDI
jgi:hypothetical protein